MSVILTCGFQSINIDLFRKKSISKGYKLLKSNHVGQVRETIRENISEVTGTVLRETPGAASTRKKENFYEPRVKLTSDRSIEEATCNCKGGKGMCKHAAAICLFVIEENTRSKTNEPMVWNRPPEAQLNKYSKGVMIDSLFPSKKGNIAKEVFHLEDVRHIQGNERHMSQFSELVGTMKTAALLQDSRECSFRIAKESELRCKEMIEKLYEVQMVNGFKTYHSYDVKCSDDQPLKLTISSKTCPEAYRSFYGEHVSVNAEKWKEICFASVNQSATEVWHKERFFRITASSKVHKIRTRQENFEALAMQFVQEKYQGRLTEAMQYGIFMESPARLWFEENKTLYVQQVGLVISIKQPYLACSPDGIIHKDGTFHLLEIKCPFSRKNLKIVNYEDKISYVPYLVFSEDGFVQLKKSDKYYSQVQMSLYVTELHECDFVVYTSVDALHLHIFRDEDFLQTLIPKVEWFYYQYMLKLLIKDRAALNSGSGG